MQSPDSPPEQKTQYSKSFDERTYINKERAYSLLSGAQKNTQWVLPASSNLTTSNVSFSIRTTQEQIIDRRIFIRYYVTLAFTGTGNPLLQIGTNDALRSFPMTTSMLNCTVNIGNQSFSEQVRDYIQALARFVDPDMANYGMGSFPNMPDQYQQYVDWVTYGSGRNPLALYGENSAQENRGGFALESITNGNGTATLNVVITEPLFISPLNWSVEDVPGICGVENIDIQMQFDLANGGLSRLWSHASSGNTLTAITATFYQPPECLYTQLVANPKTMPFFQNKIYEYPYSNIDTSLQSSSTAVASGATATIQSSQTTLSGIPEKVYIYAKRINSDQTYLTSDTFASIENINITYNTQAGILARATKQDLYDISVRNGLKMAYNQFTNYCGSVVCLQFGSDIPLNDNDCPGSSSSYQFNVSAQIKNTSSASVNYVLYVVFQYAGVMSIQNRLVEKKNYLLNSNEIGALLESNIPIVMNKRYITGEAMGSGFFGDLWSGIKNAASRASDFIKPFVPVVASAISPMLQERAQGIIKSLTGGAMSGGAMSGGAMSGGAMNRRMLAKKLSSQ